MPLQRPLAMDPDGKLIGTADHLELLLALLEECALGLDLIQDLLERALSIALTASLRLFAEGLVLGDLVRSLPRPEMALQLLLEAKRFLPE